MRILESLARPERRSGGSWSVGEHGTFQQLFRRSGKSLSGVNVTHDVALSVTTVFQAVRLISETLATVPLKLYLAEGRAKRPAREHRVYRLLHDEPNDEQTAVEAREMLVAWAVLTGTGYANIERDTGRRPTGIWPIPSYRVRPVRDHMTGDLRYLVSVPNGQQKVVRREDMIALRGFSLNGVLGEDVVERLREAVGLSIAVERFASSFFGKGTTISGAVEAPEAFSEKALNNLRRSLEAEHQGLEKAHRVMLLQDGAKFTPGGISPEQGQMLATRKFQVEEVARAFNIQPHLLMDLERATFSNIEQQFIQFVTITIRPWAVRVEQAYSKKVLTDAEKARYSISHLLEGLLRGDSETRGKFYTSLFNIGALSPNDVNELEDRNPVPGGDQRFVPLNMVPLDQARAELTDGDRSAPAPETELRNRRAGAERRLLRDRFRPLFRDAAQRWVKREVEATRAAIRRTMRQRDRQALRAWMDRFFGEDQPQYIRDQLRPVMTAYAQEVARSASEQIGADAPDLDEEISTLVRRSAAGESQAALGQLNAIMRDTEPDEVEAALEERLDEWEERSAEKYAGRAVVDAGENIARQSWRASGVVRLEWRARPDACPLCLEMNGRRVGIVDAFLGAGEELSAGDAAPLRPRAPVFAPQLHQGCDCDLVPVI